MFVDAAETSSVSPTIEQIDIELKAIIRRRLARTATIDDVARMAALVRIRTALLLPVILRRRAKHALPYPD